jgi:signal transduction histidine kinase
MIIALFAAAIIGFFAIGFIIRNLKKIVNVIREFQVGNLGARIKLKSKGELQEFANSFNDMADTIVGYIDEIKRMDGLRRELVANVSHDLRTPLSIIRGYAETVSIKDEKLTPEERKNYIETILSSTDRLLSKLEAKEIQPQFESFSLAELLQDIHQKNLIIAQSKNVKLILNMDDNLPFVHADVSMMEKVFQNLLDNAFKFTPENGEINILLNKKLNNQMMIEIRDTGIGISADDIPLIFDRYSQVKRVTSDNIPGTGLGLTIVKKILDIHGFNIEVNSELSKGTSFTISIPIGNSQKLLKN